tara:strand:- start:1482 stop:1835 length:354 start_codon:yes stop_codon:yes gene_type:complete
VSFFLFFFEQSIAQMVIRFEIFSCAAEKSASATTASLVGKFILVRFAAISRSTPKHYFFTMYSIASRDFVVVLIFLIFFFYPNSFPSSLLLMRTRRGPIRILVIRRLKAVGQKFACL